MDSPPQGAPKRKRLERVGMASPGGPTPPLLLMGLSEKGPEGPGKGVPRNECQRGLRERVGGP